MSHPESSYCAVCNGDICSLLNTQKYNDIDGDNSMRHKKLRSESVVEPMAMDDNTKLSFLTCLLTSLTVAGFLTDHLTLPNSSSQALFNIVPGNAHYTVSVGHIGHSVDWDLQEHGTYMGVCKLPDGKMHRRIDIKARFLMYRLSYLLDISSFPVCICIVVFYW